MYACSARVRGSSQTSATSARSSCATGVTAPVARSRRTSADVLRSTEEQQQRGLPALLDRERAGGQRVRLADLEHALPAAGRAPQDLVAVGERARREARHELQVLDEAREVLLVLEHELALAGRDVDLVHVVPLGHAVVEADQHRPGAFRRQGRSAAPARPAAASGRGRCRSRSRRRAGASSRRRPGPAGRGRACRSASRSAGGCRAGGRSSPGVAAPTSPAGATQTFSTPSRGAIQDRCRPSGEIRAWVFSGLPNSALRANQRRFRRGRFGQRSRPRA